MPGPLIEYVIVHPVEGIYLGSFIGLGFWTKIDPGGQTHAVTFESEKEARRYMTSWNQTPENLNIISEVRIVPVSIKREGQASIAECVQAGLEAWQP